jgi:glycosyltransferase involved in cell wall biosynthesis
MKILYLCPDIGIPVLGHTGGSAHVRGLVTAFDRAGQEVVLVAPRLDRSPWEKPAKIDGPVIHLQPSTDNEGFILYLKEFVQMLGIDNSRLSTELRRILYNKELFSQLKRRCKSERPDFIYERASLYSIAGVLLAREFNVPLILELNATLASEQASYRATSFGDLAAQAERWVLSQADAVVTVSSILRDHVVSLGVDPRRIHVMPNGVDPALFKPRQLDSKDRARWGLGEGRILGFVGGIRPWHGVKVLPLLLERLVGRYRDLTLCIVGDGPLRGDLERELKDRNLVDNYVFTSSLPQEEVTRLIPHFDVALAPYPKLDHTFYFSPLKIFEYMACGVAVVAAGVGQIEEVIRHGETGLLYPPDDIDALVSACDRLLTNPALRQRLGQSASNEVRERYTWDHNAARVIELARSLISIPEEVYV